MDFQQTFLKILCISAWYLNFFVLQIPVLNLILRSSTTQCFYLTKKLNNALLCLPGLTHILLNDMTENLEKIKISFKPSYLNHYYFGLFLSSSFSYKAFLKPSCIHNRHEFATSPFSLEIWYF